MSSLSNFIHSRRWPVLTAVFTAAVLYVVGTEMVPRSAKVVRLLREQQVRQERQWIATHWQEELARLAAERRAIEVSFSSTVGEQALSNQISTVLGLLHELAAECGVTLLHLRPEETLQREMHEELPITFRLAGMFHSIRRFVHRVEQSPLLMKVSLLRLETGDTEAGSLEGQLRLDIMLLKASLTSPEKVR